MRRGMSEPAINRSRLGGLAVAGLVEGPEMRWTADYGLPAATTNPASSLSAGPSTVRSGGEETNAQLAGIAA